MKKMLTVLALAVLICLSACALLSCKSDSDTEYRFGIVTMVENGAFTDMKSGVIKGLAEKGFISQAAIDAGFSAQAADVNTAIDYQCAGGDGGTLQSIVNSMNDASYNAVICIATPTTAAFVGLESEIPCFFCAVSAPIAAHFVGENYAVTGNVTGTSNAIPAEDIIDLALTVTGGVRKFGLIYSGTETNATNTVELVKGVLDSRQIAYEVFTAASSAEVATTASAMVAAGCDAVFVPNDSVIQAGVSSLAEICNAAGIPTFTSSATTVDSGCFAAIAIDDVEIGVLTAGQVAEYMSGKTVAQIPVIVCDINYCTIYVNGATKTALNLSLDGVDGKIVTRG